MPSSSRSRKRQSPRRQRDLQLPAGTAVPRVTLRHLARLTPDTIRKRGDQCSVRPFEMSVDINDVGAFKLVRANVLHDTVVHVTTLLLYHETGRLPEDPAALKKLLRIPKGQTLWNVPVWASCDCEHFLYTCEVALHRYNASDIIYSSGAYPRETNPRMVPQLCKHLWALAPVAVALARKPSGKPHHRRRPHPPHRGRLPRELEEALRSHDFVPTDDEVGQGLDRVRDFL